MNYWRATDRDCCSLATLDRNSYTNCLTVHKWQSVLRNPKLVTIAVGPLVSPIAAITVDSHGRLLRLAVHSKYRRLGVGTNLVQIVGANCNLTVSLRETSLGGLKFAVAVGFKVKGLQRGEFGGGKIDGVWLERNVT